MQAHLSCPTCQLPSLRVHRRYCRTARDLPVSEHPVRLLLHVRRFFCDNAACTRRTFAEPLPNLLAFRAQRTRRLTRSLQAVARALGAQAGARLASKLRMGMSHDTLLRIVRQAATLAPVTPRVLGVDDFVLKKGRLYATILVDLEHHQPIDLLPARTPESFATWLPDHPGVEVIAGERSTEYARAATDGAPAALQVAERWHLLKNHREALERMLGRLHAELAHLPELPGVGGSPTPPTPPLLRALRLPSVGEQALRQAARSRPVAGDQQLQTLDQQGVALLQIASRLRMSRATVRKFATAALFPERALQRRQSSMLDPYVPYLQQRLVDGCTNASQL